MGETVIAPCSDAIAARQGSDRQNCSLFRRDRCTPGVRPRSDPASRGRTGRRRYRGRDGHPVALPSLPAPPLQRGEGTGSRRTSPAHRRRRRPRRPGLPVLGTSRHRQDHLGADPRQGAQLREPAGRRAVLRVRVVPRRRAGRELRRPRTRRSEQQRRRCDARPDREGVARHARSPQGVHPRRGPHALARPPRQHCSRRSRNRRRTSCSCWPPPIRRRCPTRSAAGHSTSSSTSCRRTRWPSTFDGSPPTRAST